MFGFAPKKKSASLGLQTLSYVLPLICFGLAAAIFIKFSQSESFQLIHGILLGLLLVAGFGLGGIQYGLWVLIEELIPEEESPPSIRTLTSREVGKKVFTGTEFDRGSARTAASNSDHNRSGSGNPSSASSSAKVSDSSGGNGNGDDESEEPVEMSPEEIEKEFAQTSESSDGNPSNSSSGSPAGHSPETKKNGHVPTGSASAGNRNAVTDPESSSPSASSSAQTDGDVSPRESAELQSMINSARTYAELGLAEKALAKLRQINQKFGNVKEVETLRKKVRSLEDAENSTSSQKV